MVTALKFIWSLVQFFLGRKPATGDQVELKDAKQEIKGVRDAEEVRRDVEAMHANDVRDRLQREFGRPD